MRGTAPRIFTVNGVNFLKKEKSLISFLTFSFSGISHLAWGINLLQTILNTEGGNYENKEMWNGSAGGIGHYVCSICRLQ